MPLLYRRLSRQRQSAQEMVYLLADRTTHSMLMQRQPFHFFIIGITLASRTASRRLRRNTKKSQDAAARRFFSALPMMP